jgi:hypothetical protein
LGAGGGALLGVITAVLLLTTGGGDIVLVLFTLVSATAFGAVIGLVVGVANGIVIAGLSRTFLLRSQAGVSRSRVTATAVLTTGLGGLAILRVVMIGMSGVLIDALAVATRARPVTNSGGSRHSPSRPGHPGR